MSRKALAALLVPLSLFASDAQAQSRDWKRELKAKLEEAYRPTVFGRVIFTRSGTVEKPGVTLVVQKPGILASNESASFTRQSTVRNGALTRVFLESDEGQYLYKVGDKVYVQRIDVDDEVVAFRLMTADPIERTIKGSTQSDRYEVHLRFEFPKGVLPTADVAAIQKVASPFLATADEALAPKTVALGQSRADVEAILGKPDTIIDLGPKVTYVYKNLRVVFTDGKVADVQ